MAANDLERVMWAEACRMLDRAEHLQRQFFRPGRQVPAWEPPVDIYEVDGALLLVVALPGVEAQSIDVVVERTELVIRAERRLPVEVGARVRRLEIPHGCFERRLALPAGRHQLEQRDWQNGCLYLRLSRI
jgi:HSP20 family protein